MATLEIFGLGLSLVQATGTGAIGDRLLYATSTEFGINNDDGSQTFAIGSGLVWDQSAQTFTAGTVTELRHFGNNGKYAGALTGLDSPVADVEAAIEKGFLKSPLLAGDDTIDARLRANNIAVNDRLESGAGNDTVLGGAGNDRLIGDLRILESGDDALFGGDGNDSFYGGGGGDRFVGGRGTDLAAFPGLFKDLAITRTGSRSYTVTTRYGQTAISGTERIGADDGIFEPRDGGGWRKISSIPGVARAMPWSVKRGGDGNDTLRFDGFAAEAAWTHGIGLGGDGNDYLLFWGFDHDGLLMGGGGNDFIEIHTGWRNTIRAYGGDGNDHLAVYYNGGHVLNGGRGRDLLESGFGDDELSGGPDADTFSFPVLESGAAASLGDEISFGDDIITDFAIGIDRIELPENVLSRTSVSQTADGLLLTVALVDGSSGPNGTASVLLKGVQAPGASLDDLQTP